jgi:hypothetical protein
MKPIASSLNVPVRIVFAIDWAFMISTCIDAQSAAYPATTIAR